MEISVDGLGGEHMNAPCGCGMIGAPCLDAQGLSGRGGLLGEVGP
jgi:hypothetical protein